MIIRRLHKHFTAAEVTGSGETFLISSIRICPPDPTLPFKRRRGRFPIKIAFAMTISKAQGQTLKPVAVYLPSFVLWPALCGIFSIPSFDNVAVIIIEGHRKRTENDKLISQILYTEKCFQIFVEIYFF
jgi:hypothetical protein